jgi:hypothetical protein
MCHVCDAIGVRATSDTHEEVLVLEEWYDLDGADRVDLRKNGITRR